MLGCRIVTDRDAWLTARHAAWETPEAALDHAVRAATGAGIERRERIIAGEANETYRITTTDGRTVVLKVNHVWRNSFEAMREASEAFLAAGIRVPRVLLRTEVASGGRALPLVVQTYLAGTPMARAIVDASADTATRWTREAGELLARIHAIPVEVDARDEPFGTSAVADGIRHIGRVEDTLRAHGIDPDHLRSLLDRHRGALDGFPPCREHGDYGTDHLIIVGDHVSGVIDLDSTAIGTPLTDIGWWDTYFDRAPHPTATLLEGYRSVRDIGEIGAARAVFGLARSFEHLRYYLDVARPSGEAFMLRVIEERLSRVAALGVG